MTKTKPDYYRSGKFDTIDFCQHHELGFCEGNIIKYLVRAGKKDSRMHDLLKAKEYLNRLIEEEVTDKPVKYIINGIRYIEHDQLNKAWLLACVHCLSTSSVILEREDIPNHIVCRDCVDKEETK